jgi:hypothetical protein
MAELTRGQILKNPEILGTGTSGAKIRFLDGDESNHIDIKIPDIVSSNYTFTFPDTAGTNNFYLKTDGSGNTSWGEVTASPGGTNGQIQYNNSGSLAGAAVTTDGTNLFISSAAELRFGDSDNSNYVAFKSPSVVASNGTYTLPDTVGTAGQALVIASASGGAATLEWDAPSGGTTQNPGGDTDGSVQYNVGGNFTGETAFKYNQSTNTLSVDNIVSTSVTSDNINLDGNTVSSTTGDVILDPASTNPVRIAGGSPLRLFGSTTTNNYVGLVAPATVTSDYTLTLPGALGAAGSILSFDGSGAASFVSNTRTINYIIDGGGAAITTGSKGYVVIDFPCVVNSWTIVGDQSGSISVDVKRATYANFPTTTSISGTEKPTLSSAQKNQDLTLSTWTTTIAAGDILEFVVDSASTVEVVTVAIKVTPT